MTPAEVLASIRYQLDETTASFWSDAELYSYMSDAEQEVADRFQCVELSTSTTTVASTQEYTAPADCQVVRRMTWYNVPLKCIDFRQKDALQFNSYGGSDQSGNPESYYIWGDKVGLYPIPDSAQALKFYYAALPARVTTATSAFATPAIFHPCYQDYCLHRAYMKDQDDSRSMLHLKEWERSLANAADKWVARCSENKIDGARDEDNFASTDQGMI